MASDISSGAVLTADRQRNSQFNTEQKAVMCSEIFGGKSYRAVAKHLNTWPSTVHRIFKRWQSAFYRLFHRPASLGAINLRKKHASCPLALTSITS
ncbi:hypothetical protein ACQKWADRAFT_205174 [Trichoderma austrokoningii]